MDKIRVGVIGLGNMGSAHAVSVYEKLSDKCILTAVCDVNPERLAWAERFGGVKKYTSYEKMLEDNVCDAVIIATPHYYHAPCAIKAFNTGHHVMCEKPQSVSLSDAEKMNAAADKSGKVFGIMFNQRTSPLFIRAREIINSGRLGTPIRLTYIITNWYRTQRYYDTGAWRATWKGEGGGVLLNQAPHNLDIMQWIFGMPKSVYAHLDVARFHDIEVEDNAILVMRYENGATAQFITSTGEYAGTNRLEIVCSEGKLVLEGGVMKIYSLDFDEEEYRKGSEMSGAHKQPIIEEYSPSEKPEAHVGVLRAFIGKINGECELLADGREGVNQLTISNAAYLSAWTGSEISLPLDKSRFDALLEEKKKGSSYDEKANQSGASADGTMSNRWEIKW